MKNQVNWQPSKYVYKNGKLKGSRNTSEVGVASRLIVDLVAQRYEISIKKYAKGKLLDLGCGKAPLYGLYKEHTKENVCVDWSSGPHGNDHLDLECDLSKPLPFESNEFDTIILSDVLEHIPEPELLWSEMVRILNKDGVLIVNVPFTYWIHERPHDYYRYTQFALKRFVTNSDLALISLDSIGGSPEVFADFIAKHLQFVPLVGHPLASFVQFITALFIRTKLGNRISKASAEAYPLGYFLIARK